jgi:hypothetical protein
MSVRLRASIALVLAAVLVSSLPAKAQIPGMNKLKVPKVPSVPGVKPVAAPKPAEEPRAPYCSQIDDKKLDDLLKGLEAERATREREIAAANETLAKADAAAKQRAQTGFEAMVKLSECKDAAMEKDPRKKELDRLNLLAEQATAKGDEKAAEKYSNEASALSNKMDAAASKACGVGDGTTPEECKNAVVAKDPRTKQRDELTRLSQEAARKGDKTGSDQFAMQAAGLTALIESEAAMGCMAQRTTGVFGSGDAESAASKEARERLRGADDKGEEAGAKAANMTDDDYAKMKECVLGRIRTRDTTPTDEKSAAAIDARQKEFDRAFKALEGGR